MASLDKSQHGEGQFVFDHFAGKLGTFLDIGAADGVINSNTRMLALAAWKGVCVEPAPQMFCQLMKNCVLFPNVRLVNAAIAASMPRLRTFHVNTPDSVTVDQLSTLDPKHQALWAASGYPFFREVFVPVVTWNELLIGLNQWDFDFVNIDVEGINAEVLSAMPIKPKMICVEADPPDTITSLVKQIYPNVKVIGGNVLGWH